MRVFRCFAVLSISLASSLRIFACTLNVTPDDMKANPPAVDTLLGREIVRQAVLIAARDGLGQTTRDAVLREPFVKDQPLIRIDVTLNDKLSIILRNTRASDPLWQGAIGDLPKNDHNCPIVNFVALEACEKYSRGEWIDALRKLGFSGSANKSAPDAASVDGVEAFLAQHDVISQFEAIRRTRQAIATTGESPARLLDLARGYAMLGKLSELWWGAASEVYKARALLYGQRAVNEFPNSADAYYARAFAFALGGMEQKALDDFQRAAEKKQNEPSWVPLVKAYCQDDLPALANAAADKKSQALATLLAFFSVEHLPSPSAVIGYGRIAYGANPKCIRIFDGVNMLAGVAEQHRSSLYPLGIMVGAVPDLLATVSDLPQAIAKAAADQKANPRSTTQPSKVTHALLQSTDLSEPSLNQLGMLIDESYWKEVMARCEFLAFMLNSGVSQYARSVCELVPDHPQQEVLDFYSAFETDRAALGKLAELQINDVSLGMARFVSAMGPVRLPRPIGGELWQKLLAHQDYTTFSLSFFTCLAGNQPGEEAHKGRLTCAKGLMDLNPNSAIGRGTMIQDGWDQVKDKAKDWESQADHPAIAAGFARHYLQTKDYDKAKIYFEKYLAKAPDYWAYEGLASVYEAKGDEQHWLETLEKSLQAEDTGLQHAQANEKIARHFMAKSDYKRAQPYAEAAAQSWAAFGMDVAVDCYEALGEWDKCEQWVINKTQRYNKYLKWYFWCQRTGHGHLEEARQYTQQHFIEPAAGDVGEIANAMTYRLLENDLAGALKYAKMRADRGEPWPMLHMAFIYWARHLDAAANGALENASKPPADRQFAGENSCVDIAKWIRESLQKDPAALDLKTVDQIIQRGDYWKPEVAYFAAKFLLLHGRAVDAKKYFQIAANEPLIEPAKFLSAVELRKE